jgi:coenzyme F420-reducing hydrogenase beta subunit
MQKENLFDTVIKNDYCIGCGACSFVNPDYEVKLDEYGMLKANIKKENLTASDHAELVCPFSNKSDNEDIISDRIFDQANNYNSYLGKYIKNYVGYVNEGEFREKGSSGGFGKWLLSELLIIGEVDYVIQVVSELKKGELFKFQVFKKGDDLLKGSKSAYYPITLKNSLDFIKENEGTYAITAVPCFAKALRNICVHDEVINNRIKYIVGLICGHLKSTSFAESLAWQLNVNPKNLNGIEFRDKIEGLKANEKGVYVIDQNGEKSIVKSSKTLFGGNWGHGFFKYKACDYCDDIVGETADVSFGDAWLEDLMSDYLGNNVVIVRNKRINEIIENAILSGRVEFKEVEDSIVVKSQLGGIRHRREGLSFRLFLKEEKNEWVPRKRITSSSSIPNDRKEIYNMREKIRDFSHLNFKKAKQKNDFEFFRSSMIPFIDKLTPSLTFRILRKIKSIFIK